MHYRYHLDIPDIPNNLVFDCCREPAIRIDRKGSHFLGNYNRDAYQLSGYGTALITGLQVRLLDGFFIQSEWKGGYISMPKVRISAIDSEKASHSFLFHQYNFVFGYGYTFGK